MPPSLEVVGPYAPSAGSHNILFLGEGFTAADSDAFERLVGELRERLFSAVPPFNLSPRSQGKAPRSAPFSKRFVTYLAFTPGDSGISIHDDKPNPATGVPDKIRIDVDSGLRLLYEGNVDGFPLYRLTETTPNYIYDLVRSLVHPFEAAGESAVPQCWLAEDDPLPPNELGLAKDCGFVVILVKEDWKSFSPNPYLPHATLGAIRPSIVFTGLPVKDTGNLCDIVAHELGHSRFMLADEYADDSKTNRQSGENTTDRGANTTSRDETRLYGIAYQNLKWKQPLFPGSTKSLLFTEVATHMKSHLGDNASLLFDTGYDSNPEEAIAKELQRDPDGWHARFPPVTLGKLARSAWELVGLYEGGRYYRFGTYTPAGQCKMRNYVYDFCHVCQHHIVSTLAADLLEALEDTACPGRGRKNHTHEPI